MHKLIRYFTHDNPLALLLTMVIIVMSGLVLVSNPEAYKRKYTLEELKSGGIYPPAIKSSEDTISINYKIEVEYINGEPR